MEKSSKVIRKSIYTLLKDFHYFNTNPVIILLPFSASFLLFQSIHQSNFFVLPTIYQFLDLNFHQLTCIFLFVSLAFTLISSLIIAKTSIIRYLDDDHHKPNVSSFIYISITFLLLVALGFVEASLDFSLKNPIFVLATRIVLYTILMNTMIICNLSLVIAVSDKDLNNSYFKAIRKACLLRKNTNYSTTLLAFPINFGVGAIQYLFRYRIVRDFYVIGRVNLSMVLEGVLISYMFSVVIVVDTIVCCLFVKTFYSQVELVKESSSNADSLDEIV
ncbi:uncharacterized protein LOC126678620 [Mercurialis annua]|uniref:uncharacterized protein LOC126678620 n=1 Tax=Mercurialis annua TaxID=3986 RepID=UPI00215F919E|nr:uncharacterized protein LOC126678620 [Mercurialis annua]